jgi:hypothetical protein
MAVADDDLISSAPDRPCGYARYATQLTAAINLDTAPTNGKKLSECKGKPNRALLQCETQDVRWTDDPDVDPTATVGMLLKVNTVLEYSGDLSKFRIIQTAATAVLHVSYYNS